MAFVHLAAGRPLKLDFFKIGFFRRPRETKLPRQQGTQAPSNSLCFPSINLRGTASAHTKNTETGTVYHLLHQVTSIGVRGFRWPFEQNPVECRQPVFRLEKPEVNPRFKMVFSLFTHKLLLGLTLGARFPHHKLGQINVRRLIVAENWT